MQPGINIKKVWFDEDFVEFKIEVFDGASSFSTNVYEGNNSIGEMVSKLKIFREQIHGGLLDIQFGEFGPEYAYGAFRARFHFPDAGLLFITCRMESRFKQFGRQTVASNALLYLKSEPVLLDNFISDLRLLNTGNQEGANLEAVR